VLARLHLGSYAGVTTSLPVLHSSQLAILPESQPVDI